MFTISELVRKGASYSRDYAVADRALVTRRRDRRNRKLAAIAEAA